MVLGEKVFDGQQSLRVRDAGVESSDVHSEQIAVLAVRGKGKILKKLECVVGVLEVGWEPSHDGLKDEIEKAGDLDSRTGTGGNNGASRGVGLVDLGQHVKVGFPGFSLDEGGGFTGQRPMGDGSSDCASDCGIVLFGGGFGDGAVKGGVGELTLSLCKVQVPAPDHDRATLIGWLDHNVRAAAELSQGLRLQRGEVGVAKGVRGEPADLRSAGSDVEVQGGKLTWGRSPGRWGTRKGGGHPDRTGMGLVGVGNSRSELAGGGGGKTA
jgi:hypothetical protein